MGRPRKPIEGWDDTEVDNWLRQYRGTPHECVAHLMPHLRGKPKARACQRAREWVKKMEAEGLDFSISRAPPKRPTLRVLAQVSKLKPDSDPPPPVSRFAPTPSESVPNVAGKSRLDILQWVINQAAAKASEMPPDKSAASYLKLVTEMHAELDQLRKTDTGDDVSLDVLCDILPRIVTKLPNSVLDIVLKEYFRRNPKQTVAVKSRVAS